MENGRMEFAGQDRDSRYCTAHNFLLAGQSCMDQERYSEAWDYVQEALVIGKQLKDWTVQSSALRVLSLCCRPMGGPQDSERNVTWWDEALTEARKHGDPFLEAMVLKSMGHAAAQKYGDYRALEESAQLWLANMKALRLRGESGVPGLRRCAIQMLITKQYLAMGPEKGGGWEGLLREALVYADILGDSKVELHHRYSVLQLLVRTCDRQPGALKGKGQVWREKAAVYRQHAMAVLERMGQPVPKDCLLCNTALHADKPVKIRKLSMKSHVYLNDCGHILHLMCQAKSKASGPLGTSCPVCAGQASKMPSGNSWW
ncbi:TPA: hypothetical protein ACH3X2_005778 [Trebouxia sp. C0005]